MSSEEKREMTDKEYYILVRTAITVNEDPTTLMNNVFWDSIFSIPWILCKGLKKKNSILLCT